MINQDTPSTKLLKERPIVFYELVMACRDRSHSLFGNAGEELVQWGLIESKKRGPDEDAGVPWCR